MRLFKYSLIFFLQYFVAIVQSPPTAWNRETRSDAHSFLLAMSQFSFIVALIYSQKVLGYTKGLSVKLQGRVVRAYRDIESIKTTVKGASRQLSLCYVSTSSHDLSKC